MSCSVPVVPTTDVRYSTRGPMRCCTALLPLFGAGALGAILVIYLWPIMLHGSANPTSIEISTPSFIVNYSIYPTSCGTKGSITTCWEAYVDVSPVNSTVVCSLEKSVYNSIADALYELRRDNPISNTTVVTVYFDSSKRMCSWSSVPIPEDWTLLAPFIIVFMIGLIAGGLGGMGIGFVLDLLFDFCCPCCCRNC